MTKTGYLRGFKRLTAEEISEEKERLRAAGIRLDVETGKLYNSKNIPLGILSGVATPTGKQYRIGSQNGNSDVWYNDRFLGDNYAVFVKVEKCGFWQQITPWYCRVGNAVKRMIKISQEG